MTICVRGRDSRVIILKYTPQMARPEYVCYYNFKAKKKVYENVKVIIW